mgnify:CR=1 FL=1
MDLVFWFIAYVVCYYLFYLVICWVNRKTEGKSGKVARYIYDLTRVGKKNGLISLLLVYLFLCSYVFLDY